ncbi:MAG: hypothetical protein WCQ50_22135 [Spirochaetota bacterium]
MKLLWYPDYGDTRDASSVYRNLAKDLAREKILLVQVEAFLERVESLADLGQMAQSEQVAPLGNGLHEMRIPKVRTGGVVRIYFCHAIADHQTLVLLEAEFKHTKAAQKRPSAERRLSEYREREKRKE